MISSRKWKFTVRCQNIEIGETVCITGSVKTLGEWKIPGVVPMEQLRDNNDGEHEEPDR